VNIPKRTHTRFLQLAAAQAGQKLVTDVWLYTPFSSQFLSELKIPKFLIKVPNTHQETNMHLDTVLENRRCIKVPDTAQSQTQMPNNLKSQTNSDPMEKGPDPVGSQKPLWAVNASTPGVASPNSDQVSFFF